MAYKVNQELANQSVATSTERLSRSGGDNNLNWYDMKAGSNRLRFLPPWNPHGILAFERFHHYLASGNVVTCLNTFKGTAWDVNGTIPECPICKALEELNSLGHDVSGKWPRFNAYFNVLDLDNVAAGVQVCRLPTTPFNNLMQFQSVPEIGDFTDPLTGFNLLVTRTGESLDTKYTVTLLPVRSPIYVLQDGTPDLASIDALVGNEASPENNELFPIERIWSCPDATGIAEMTGKAIALKAMYLGAQPVAPTPPVAPGIPPAQPAVPVAPLVPAVPAPVAPIAPVAPLVPAVAPVVPVVPIAPVAPIAPVVPVVPTQAVPVVPQVPIVPAVAPVAPQVTVPVVPVVPAQVAPVAPVAPVVTPAIPPPPVSTNVPTGQLSPETPHAPVTAVPQTPAVPTPPPVPPVPAPPVATPAPTPPIPAVPAVPVQTELQIAIPDGSPDCWGKTYLFNPGICNPCQFSETCKTACGK